MSNSKFQIGETVNYTHNCNNYNGVIKSVKSMYGSFSYVIINEKDNASNILWNQGYAVGDCIMENQITN